MAGMKVKFFTKQEQARLNIHHGNRMSVSKEARDILGFEDGTPIKLGYDIESQTIAIQMIEEPIEDASYHRMHSRQSSYITEPRDFISYFNLEDGNYFFFKKCNHTWYFRHSKEKKIARSRV